MLRLSKLLFVLAAFSEDTPQYLCLYPFCMEASLPKQRLILWISFPHALENGLRSVLAAEVWGYIEGRGREPPETPRVTEGGGQSVLIFIHCWARRLRLMTNTFQITPQRRNMLFSLGFPALNFRRIITRSYLPWWRNN